DGSTYDIDLDALTTVQDFIDAVDTASAGDVTVSLTRDRLEFSYNGSGTGAFSIADANGATAATELGIVQSVTANAITATNGAGASLLTLTDRDGDSVTVDIDGLENLSDIIEAINTNAAANNVDLTVSLNSSKNGLRIDDSSGGTVNNLIITGSAAENLGISTGAGGVNANSLRGDNVQLQYVSVASLLSDLNFGRGVGTGSFTITDGLGESATVNIGSDSQTLNDVILEINSRGLAVRAEINENGDGIVLKQDDAELNGQTPFIPIKVVAAGGSVAADLRILGESDTVANAEINGSYEVVVDLETSDSLNDVVNKINAAGVPVSASVINTGTGSQPYRLSLTSEITGTNGELVIDSGDVDLALTSISRGQDAKVFFGSENPEDAFLLSSDTNSLTGVIQDVTIDLLKAGPDAVTITVTRDSDAVVEEVSGFVASFNEIISRINEYDFFDIDSEERGILLGDPTLLSTRNALYQTLLKPATGVGTQYTRLSQIGVKIGDGATLSLDEAKFREALSTDREAVINLFTAFEQETSSTETIAEGITVSTDSQTTTAAGIGRIFEEFLETLVNTSTGVFERADQRFASQIELAQGRIETIDQRVEAQRTRLERQFLSLELALSDLQAQGSAIGGISIPQISF
ncbi:MAG: flagellar filament capping protein FliD, partial [Phycisphaerales bacterium]|nr:flagellar filament capping protein FliD [Phycisphaerales bacterium]